MYRLICNNVNAAGEHVNDVNTTLAVNREWIDMTANHVCLETEVMPFHIGGARLEIYTFLPACRLTYNLVFVTLLSVGLLSSVRLC